MSRPTRFDPAIVPVATLSAADYMADDGTDQSAGLRAMAAARAAIAGAVLLFFPTPRVAWHVVSDAPTGANPVVVSLLGDTIIAGEPDGAGGGSLLTWAGVLHQGDFGNVADTGAQQLFHLAGARVLLRDLTIQGDNDPFVAYANNQSAAIKAKSTDVLIRDVTLRTLVGFTAVDDFTGPGRNGMMRCTLDRCANGTNFGSDYSIQYRNRYISTEGTEYAGAPGLVALNDMQGGSISVGGDTAAGARKAGTLVVANSTNNSNAGVVAIIAEAYVDGWAQANVIEGATKTAMQVGSSANADSDGNTVVDNYTRSAIQSGSGSIGLEIASPASHSVVASNDVRGTTSGIEVRASDVSLFDNTADSGSAGANAIVLQATAQRAVLVGNAGTVHAQTGSTQVATPARPTGASVKLFGDVTQGFATLQVLNWDKAPFVSVTLGGVGLAPGDTYHILHPYHLLDAVYQSGVYTGDPIQLSMRPVPPPTDWPVSTTEPLPTLGPRFNAFLVVKTGHESLLDYNPGARLHMLGGHFINLLLALFGRRAGQAVCA